MSGTEQIQLKIAWSKKKLSSNPHKMYKNYILLKVFIYKNAILGDFSKKKKELPPVYGGDFVYFARVGVIYYSQAANRSANNKRPLAWGAEGKQSIENCLSFHFPFEMAAYVYKNIYIYIYM